MLATKFSLKANVKLRFVNGLGMPAGCTLSLLALDCVYLNSVPRILPDNILLMSIAVPRILMDNVLLLSIASRVDVAARCDVPGPVLMQVSPLGVDAYNTIGTIHVKPSDQPREPDLLAWVPCRPHYLADLQHDLPAQSADVELRGDVNGALLTTDYAPLFNFERSAAAVMTDYAPLFSFQAVLKVLRVLATGVRSAAALDSVNEFVMVNLQEHPAHLHVNHVQLQGAPTSFADVPGWLQGAPTSFADVPGWFQPGDWYDTVSHPVPVTTRFVTDRFSRAMMLHCHVYAHSDNGVAAMMAIAGKGADADASPRFLQSGTWPLAIPTAGKVGIGLEGKMEAEDFDEGGPGIAYMDTTDQNMGGNMYRGDAAVDIEACGVCSMTTNTGFDINFNEKGEWLKYTIEVQDTAYYTPSITISGPLPDPPAPPAPLVPPPPPPKGPPVIAKTQGPPARLLLKVAPGKPAKPVKPAKPAPLAVQMYVAVTPGAWFEAADPVCADGAPMATPGTVDYVTYAAFPSPKNLLLYEGAVCVKLCVTTGGFNIDFFSLAPALDVPPPPTGPINGAPAALPGVVAATAFDLGTNAMVNGVLVPKPPKSASYGVQVMPAPPSMRADAAPSASYGVESASYGVQVMPGPPSMRADAAPVSTAECEACPGGFAVRGLAQGEFLLLPKGNRIVVMAGMGQCIARAAPYKCQPALERRASVALDQAFASTGGIRVCSLGAPFSDMHVCSLGAPFSLSEFGVWPVYDPVKVTIPGTIEAENFDIGTMGVTYFDTTPENNGGNVGYRPDAPEVDVEVGNANDKIMSNNADIKWVATGEWWRYTVTAHAPRAAYTAALSVARAAPTPDPGAMALVLTAAYKYGERATPATPALLLEAVYPDDLADGYYAYHTLGGGGGGATRSVEMDAGQHCLQGDSDGGSSGSGSDAGLSTGVIVAIAGASAAAGAVAMLAATRYSAAKFNSKKGVADAFDGGP
ncbi:hypothetical protein JKP88DRAFT_290768 [Tribonema minus]|uniref:Plastocyanin-like domain-containing protein n=1 Tax=Tribonema minus TaxID=303371 RepID=A0A836CF80_9STRA|nr:hypothetical protein JKP88DRAFT_290768 [Tribonema minus]